MNSSIQQRVQARDWPAIAQQINDKGYAVIKNMLSHEECDRLSGTYDSDTLYRKTIVMEKYRFGSGAYKYFQYPLPAMIDQFRAALYEKLAPVANTWMQTMGTSLHYPARFAEWQSQCHQQGQDKPTVLILKYQEGGHNTLHQDLYGDLYFPIQAVFILSEPGIDYTGGEFVLVQQTPRAQSKAMVLTPGKGDLLLFTTHSRPVQGSKRTYRVNMKHGVSELHSGERFTLGIIFHDAE